MTGTQDGRDKTTDWRIADETFSRLLDLPREARMAHLQALGLDPQLRQRVERMLAAMREETPGILDEPGLVSAMLKVDALAGRKLGRWELVEEIGRGGMAVIYRAVSVEGPAGQPAAVKVLTLGALAGRGRRQFLREQESLLRLRHPYIVPLFDAGVASDGTPWLAMGQVDGTRIDEWCDVRGLDAAARVKLLLQVCEALAHAHRNLVIHRDIKPSNVLVDEDGRVRLLDFGISRLADDDDMERTTTIMRELTPAYASPEQFEGAAATTAMDVYGVGALLYRLLAGAAPRGAAPEATSPPMQPPSRVVRVRGGASEGTRRLQRVLRGDLDAIVMKALATRPEARYSGVAAFAEDLERWLQGKPVRAQPPSPGYRLQRFIGRHKLPVMAATAVLVAIIAGLGTALWQAHRAERMATVADAARQQAEVALRRSNAIRDFLFDLFRSASPDRPRDELPTTAEVLADAARLAPERFAADTATQAEFLAALASVYADRGMPEGIALRRQVLALRESTRAQDPRAHAMAQASLAGQLADNEPAEAARLLAEALPTLERIAPGSRALVDALRSRANLDMFQGDVASRQRNSIRIRDLLLRLPDATAVERFRAAAIVAAGHHQAGAYEQALVDYDLAMELGAIAYDYLDRDLVTVRANRAGVLSHLGRFGEARAEFLATNVDYERIFDRPRGYTFANLRELEMVYLRQGNLAEALRARDEWDRLLDTQPASPQQDKERAKSKVWRAVTLARMGEREHATRLLDEAMPLFDETGERARNRGIGLNVRLRLACDRPQAMPPADALAQALELAPAMRGDRRPIAAEALALAGLCELRSGRPREALAYLDRAREPEGELPPGDAAMVAEHLSWRSEALEMLGDRAGARQARDAALRAISGPGFAGHPLHAKLRGGT